MRELDVGDLSALFEGCNRAKSQSRRRAKSFSK